MRSVFSVTEVVGIVVEVLRCAGLLSVRIES